MTSLLFLLGCSHPVDITLTAAEIAPTTADGQPWDGPSGMDTATKGLVGLALGRVDPTGQLGEALTDAASNLARPDATGVLTFVPGDGKPAVSAVVPEASDTLAPTWAPGAGTLHGVLWSPKASLDVTLIDKDVSSDDPIGKVRLSAAQLAQAEARDGALTLDVSNQTSGQLRSVSVVVVRSEAKPAK
jgi:hypothetical protein